MRQIDDGLRNFLGMDVDHFIKQQGKNDGETGGQQQLDHAQLKGIVERVPEIRHGEQTREVIQPDPHGVLDDGIFGEGKVDAEHRQIMENNEECQHRQKQ